MNAPKYHEQQRLIDALRQWQGKPYLAFPADRPPCGYIPGAGDENHELARTFAAICALATFTERMTYLQARIATARRHIAMYENAVRGERNPRLVGSNASREAWAALKPQEAFADALERWRDGLLDAWDGEIGAQFIDEAAHQRAAS